jgi:hypothetical protein
MKNACTAYPEHAAKKSDEQRTIFESGYLCDDGEDGDENAGSSDSGHCAAEDEEVHRMRDGAEQRPELEDEDR